MGLNLSFSACNKYTVCKPAYYYHYQLRLRPIQTGSPLPFGSSIDIGLNTLLQQKKDNKAVDVVEAKEQFLANWTEAEINGKKCNLCDSGLVKFSKSDLDLSLLNEEEKNSNNPSWHCMKHKGNAIIEAYAEQVIPKLDKIHAIQHKISLKNEYGDEFTGFVDLIADINGQTVLIDNKTAASRYTATSASESPQLATYFESCKEEFKLEKVGFFVAPKQIRKKKEPLVPIDMIFGDISEELIAQTFQTYDEVLYGIKSGNFEPKSIAKCCDNPYGCSYQRYIASECLDMTGLEYVSKSGR